MSAILDLQRLLKGYKDFDGNMLDVPDHLILQFDNCSEKKVFENAACYS